MEECEFNPLDTDANEPHCNSTFDTVLCWPPTLYGHTAHVPCPHDFDGVPLNRDAFATKLCSENGTWAFADYNLCMMLEDNHNQMVNNEKHNYAIRIIYNVGFAISTAALLVALFIFFYFRTLRCLRNMIHCQLMITFVLKNIMWMALHHLLPIINEKHLTDDGNGVVFAWLCRFVVATYNYFVMTNNFWMLVEGLYLHIMIVYAYSVDKMKMWMYAILGWGVPLVIIVVWMIVKRFCNNNHCWLPTDNYYDYIFIGPILLVLLANTCCLISTMYIVFTKLRATPTQQQRNFWQTLKGTIILLPLLGIIYVIMLVPPGNNPIAIQIFLYFNAIAQSSQGLAVAVFYCFLNREVKNVLRNRIERYQNGRSFAAPRTSRGESLMYHPTRNDNGVYLEIVRNGQHKGSTASNVTTVSSLNGSTICGGGGYAYTTVAHAPDLPSAIDECNEDCMSAASVPIPQDNTEQPIESKDIEKCTDSKQVTSDTDLQVDTQGNKHKKDNDSGFTDENMPMLSPQDIDSIA